MIKSCNQSEENKFKTYLELSISSLAKTSSITTSLKDFDNFEDKIELSSSFIQY
jgi:hypothetical protein